MDISILLLVWSAIAGAAYAQTHSLLWTGVIVGVVVLGSVVLLLLWERIRTNPDRIREAKQRVYESELGHTFVDQVAYFRIFGRELGPFPIVPVNAGRMQGPCFVRCLAFFRNEGRKKSYLAFRITSYVPR